MSYPLQHKPSHILNKKDKTVKRLAHTPTAQGFHIILLMLNIARKHQRGAGEGAEKACSEPN